MRVEEIAFGEHLRACWVIELSPEEYVECEAVSCNMWANTKTGNYGRGMLNSKTDPFRVERTGKIGEYSFGKLYELAMDKEYKVGGDKGDFLINGKTIDIKTASSRKYNEGLIRAFTEKGNRVKLHADIFIFTYLEEDRAAKTAKLTFIGWFPTTELFDDLVRPAKRGYHYNYEIPYHLTKPMSDLKDYL